MIQPPGKSGITWRYHQYTLLTRKVGEKGEEEWEEDLASPILFHVQPPDSKPHAPKSALQTGPKAAAAIARTDPVRLPNSLSSYGACLPIPVCPHFRTTGLTDHYRCGADSAAMQTIAAELLEGPSVNNRLAQAIPTFTSEIIDSLVCAHVLQSFCEHPALRCCCLPTIVVAFLMTSDGRHVTCLCTVAEPSIECAITQASGSNTTSCAGSKAIGAGGGRNCSSGSSCSPHRQYGRCVSFADWGLPSAAGE